MQQARAQAAAAEAALAAQSRARLAELLRKGSEARLAALEDPDLLPVDRATLYRSLQAELRRSSWSRLLPHRRLARLWDELSRRRGLAIRCGVGLVPLILLLGFAVSRDAELAVLRAPLAVTLVNPKGFRENVTLTPGRLTVRRLDATRAEARWWISGRGYRTAVIPLAALHVAP